MGALYSEQPSWLHRVPAAAKLCVLALAGALLFAVRAWPLLLALVAGCALLFVSLGAATRGVRRLLRSVVWAALLVAAFHLLWGQFLEAATSALRLCGAAMLGMSVTVSTSTTDILDLLERLLRPMQRRGWRPYRVGLRVALTLRFVDQFFAQWQRLDDACRVRTGRAGGLRLLAPLTILMLLAARRVADTLQVRLGD